MRSNDIRHQLNGVILTAQGYSLVEILVSLVVISVGLLGLASLQTTAFKYNQNSATRSLAVAQASAMADRIRANTAGMGSGAYDSISGTPATPPTCSPCTAAQMALIDEFEWNTANANLLPQGQGTVARSGSAHVITVMWDAAQTGATGTDCSGNPLVDLACYRLTIQY